MSEEETVKEQLNKILEYLKENESKKQFKLPWGMRVFGGGKIRKKNYVVVQLIRTNGQVDFKFLPVEDNTIKIDKMTYHEAGTNHILRYKKWPMIILPEWNLRPFSPKENMEQAIKEGTLTSAEKFIISKVEGEALKKKMNINLGLVLLIIVGLVGGYYLLKYMHVF